MWFFTVFGLMCSSAAICALSFPFAISRSTCSSRSESSEAIASSRAEGSPGPEALKHLGGDRRRDQRLAVRRRLDAGEELVDRRLLEQVAAGARHDRVHHVGVLVGRRQHENARERCGHRDLRRRLDAADPGHVHVHHDDVRGQRPDLGDASVPVRASPTTSTPSASSSVRRPVRNRSWSSTRRTRGEVSGLSFDDSMSRLLPRRVRQELESSRGQS